MLIAGGALTATATFATGASGAQAETIPSSPDNGLNCQKSLTRDQAYGSANCTDVTGSHVWRVHVGCGVAPDQYTDWVVTEKGATTAVGKACPSYSTGLSDVQIDIQRA